MTLKRIALAILILLLLSSCALENRRKRTFLAMGNIPVEVSLYSKENLDFNSAFMSIESEVKRLDAMMSKYNDKSEVFLFNESRRSVKASEEFRRLLLVSDSMRDKTGGLFNVQIETLLRYYRECEKNQIDPSPAEIERLVRIMTEDSVYVKGDSVIKSNEELRIDFGGIAKGYFGDISVGIMKQFGFKKGMVNMGGDIVALNESDGRYFKIGIRSSEKDSVVRIDSIADGSIVTSGDYFRYYEINGKRYCHIISPVTGLPAEGIHSVTVKAETGVKADAFATAVMLMTDEEISKFEKAEGISVFLQK